MTKQEDTKRKSGKDLLLILLILPFGVLCMFMTGQAAIRLAPTWMLPVNMFSNLNPNAVFAGLSNPLFIEPINPGILTQPVWDPLFLTPNASIPTRVYIEVSTPRPVITPQPTPEEANTPIVIQSPLPTATSIGPALPTQSTPRFADLIITKTDNSNIYTPGTSMTYTIVVYNNGPDDATRFNIIDNIPANISGLTVNCTPASNCGTNTSSGNTISFTSASLETKDQLKITVSGIVDSGAIGNLSNTAEAIVPSNAGYRDLFEASNVATDTDTQRSVYDVEIIKSDGINTYVATDTQFTYTVEVINHGPSDAIRIRVVDNIPPQFTSWDWECTIETDARGCDEYFGRSDDFSDRVSIESGGRIVYTVTGYLEAVVPPQNPQVITNTASIELPSGPGVIVESDLTNNSSTDTNSPYIDLQIKKDDGVTTYSPGDNLIYIVTVTNNSTFALSGITVTDNMPSQISAWSWTCAPPSGPPSTASCTPSGAGNINDTAVYLPAGASVIYRIDATVSSSASGLLENIASVSPPAGLPDSVPGNNTATDSNNALANLSISKLANVPNYTPGGSMIYTITASNPSGPSNVFGATVTDTFPDSISSATWTCATTGSASCTASGSGNISDTVNLPVGTTVTYTVNVTISSSATGAISNTATVAAPAGVTDLDTSNNSSTVTTDAETCTLVGGQVTVPPGGCSFVRNSPGPSNGNIYTITNTGSSSLGFIWFGLSENQTSGTCGPWGVSLAPGNTLSNIAIEKFANETNLIISNMSGGSVIIRVTESSWSTGGCN
jgi:uncharacterized repeat protein (TIGR01451 family)